MSGGRPALSVRELLLRRGAGRSVFELEVDELDLWTGGALAVLGPI